MKDRVLQFRFGTGFSTDWVRGFLKDRIRVRVRGFLRFRVQGLSGDLGISFLLIQDR